MQKIICLSHTISERTPLYGGEKSIIVKKVKSIKRGDSCKERDRHNKEGKQEQEDNNKKPDTEHNTGEGADNTRAERYSC